MPESAIYFNDLLQMDNFDNVKIKFNKFNGKVNPLDEFKNHPEVVNNQWLFWRTTQRYFSVGQIAICLLKMGYDTWLLTTIKKVTEELDVKNGINYKGEEIEEYKPYFGRVIIKFHKDFQAQGRFVKGIISDMEVLQILPTTYDGEDFPGYDKVRLTYKQLKTIIDRHKKDWIAALENQKAVYLITDTNTGKLYVGSATGDNGMLLQRWSSYVANGHGGNEKLVELVEKVGFDYVKKNFQYSILENYNAKVEDSVILERESWWKETLYTRKSGYNGN